MSPSLLIRTKISALSGSVWPIIGLLAVVPLAGLSSTPINATESSATDAGPQSGTLMLKVKGAATTAPAVQLGSDMDVTVSGSIARVRVTQVFRNTAKNWMEATYLYPLPEDAAVDSLKMVAGQRVIIGRIKQRNEARAIYDKARQDGQKAGLVEQQRPNMFTNSVANIGPGETVMITIEYQMPLKQARGLFSLRLPLVVGPRYVPPHSIASNADAVDAGKVTAAPVLHPKIGAKINPVSIAVHLNPGFVPANITSAYHKIAVAGDGDQRTIQLAKGEVPSDRDFELSWRSASADPTVALYREQVGDKGYVMASITPPIDDDKAFVPPRDMIFVIDNSGSMSGASMDQAKSSLINALKTLRPQDHFNVIRFDDTMTKLFTTSVAASDARVAEAMTYTRGLQATGGTEMLPALIAALAHDEKANVTKAVRQIIFLTDGSISNEKEMIAAISADKGRSHIFLVGIGSAPNTYLMTRMANMGRGTYTNIGSTQEVTAKMASLIDVLSRPSVQGLSVKVSGNSFDLTPRMLPDLYAGEPLLLLGQADKLEGSITVSGRIGGKAWSQTLDLKTATPSPSVAKLWARRRIDDVEADLALGIIDSKAADAAVTKLGLTYGLVTSQTSLVAIDETPTRPLGQVLRMEELPINLPDGWDFEALFGGETAAMAAANAQDKATFKATQEVTAIDLPQTATNFAVLILKGLFLFLLGAKGLFALRLKRTSSK